MRCCVGRNQFNGFIYLAGILANDVFLMQYYEPLRKFMHLKVRITSCRDVGTIVGFVADRTHDNHRRTTDIRDDLHAGQSIRFRMHRCHSEVSLCTLWRVDFSNLAFAVNPRAMPTNSRESTSRRKKWRTTTKVSAATGLRSRRLFWFRCATCGCRSCQTA